MTDRSRTKILVPLGLACVLIVATLTLWRPVGHSSRIPPPEREIHFPEDRSVGRLYVRDWNSTWTGQDMPQTNATEWKFFGKAQGTVTVPFGQELRLRVFRIRDQYLSLLPEIRELNLQMLEIFGERIPISDASNGSDKANYVYLTIADDDLRFIRGLRSLRALEILAGDNFGDAGLIHLQSLTRLEHLRITNARITDEGLVHLQSLPRLENLYISNARITDEGLVHLRSMRSLKRLQLVGNQITPEGMALLKLALPDCFIGPNVTSWILSFWGRPSPTPPPTPSPQIPIS